MMTDWNCNSELLQDINRIRHGRISERGGPVTKINKSRVIPRFKEQITVFANEWKAYKKAEKQKDKDFNSFRWLRRNYDNLNQYPLPPDPTTWEPDNELPCAYAALTTIWNHAHAQKTASKRICPDVWDGYLFAWMIFRCKRYDKARIESALALVKDDLLIHCVQGDGPRGSPVNADNASRINLEGMPHQTAKIKAEKYIDENGFPGITKLKADIGCSRGTMRKAINKSEKLTRAEKEYRNHSGRPTAESLTDGVVAAREESREIAPSVLADTDALLKKLVRDAPVTKRAETQAQIDGMSQEQRQELAATFAQQVDDKQQDDPETRKPRTLRP